MDVYDALALRYQGTNIIEHTKYGLKCSKIDNRLCIQYLMMIKSITDLIGFRSFVNEKKI